MQKGGGRIHCIAAENPERKKGIHELVLHIQGRTQRRKCRGILASTIRSDLHLQVVTTRKSSTGANRCCRKLKQQHLGVEVVEHLAEAIFPANERNCLHADDAA